MISIEEFRDKMVAYRKLADEEARRFNESFLVACKLRSFYEGLNDHERPLANQILCEWVLSDNEGIRFDALALVDDLRIDMTLPAIHALYNRIARSLAPSAPFELKKLSRIISRLEAISP